MITDSTKYCRYMQANLDRIETRKSAIAEEPIVQHCLE